jgi:hypothetical protein
MHQIIYGDSKISGAIDAPKVNEYPEPVFDFPRIFHPAWSSAEKITRRAA